MTTPANDLRAVVLEAAPQLRARDATWAAAASGPGKWSPRQVIGHLIDSASNNHQRFVRARFRSDLVFEGYDQDAWVEAQAYADAPWSELLDLWVSFNLHLARVMETCPEDVLRARRGEHNLDRIAWEPVPSTEPVDLAYFMRDYVSHLRHHLHRLDPELCPPPPRQR